MKTEEEKREKTEKEMKQNYTGIRRFLFQRAQGISKWVIIILLQASINKNAVNLKSSERESPIKVGTMQFSTLILFEITNIKNKLNDKELILSGIGTISQPKQYIRNKILSSRDQSNWRWESRPKPHSKTFSSSHWFLKRKTLSQLYGWITGRGKESHVPTVMSAACELVFFRFKETNRSQEKVRKQGGFKDSRLGSYVMFSHWDPNKKEIILLYIKNGETAGDC